MLTDVLVNGTYIVSVIKPLDVMCTKHFSAFATRSIHAFQVLLGLRNFGVCSVLDMERQDASCTEFWEKLAFRRLRKVRSETCCEDGKRMDVAPDHAWCRDVVLAVLNLGSCYQKGSVEVTAVSIDWMTEESGLGPRQGPVFVSPQRPDRLRGPSYLLSRVPGVERWVVLSVQCSGTRGAIPPLPISSWCVILVQGQLHLT